MPNKVADNTPVGVGGKRDDPLLNVLHGFAVKVLPCFVYFFHHVSIISYYLFHTHIYCNSLHVHTKLHAIFCGLYEGTGFYIFVRKAMGQSDHGDDP